MEQNIGKGEVYPLTYFNIDILKKAHGGKPMKNPGYVFPIIAARLLLRQRDESENMRV